MNSSCLIFPYCLLSFSKAMNTRPLSAFRMFSVFQLWIVSPYGILINIVSLSLVNAIISINFQKASVLEGDCDYKELFILWLVDWTQNAPPQTSLATGNTLSSPHS